MKYGKKHKGGGKGMKAKPNTVGKGGKKGGAGTAFGVGLAGGGQYKQGPKGHPCNESHY